MNAPLVLDWTSANQQLLVAEFARLRTLLGDGDTTEARRHVADMARQMPAPAAIDTLATVFDLSVFERDLLLLAVGVEMDARLAALCAQGQGQPQRPWATFGLAMAALPEPHWSAITPVRPLRRLRLVDIDDGSGLSSGRVKVDERVLHFIAGLNYLDHRLQALITAEPDSGLMDETHRWIAQQAVRDLRSGSGALPPVLLHGDDADGQRDVASLLAHELGVALYHLRARDVPEAAHEQASLASLWQREAALLGAGLLLTRTDDAHGDALVRLLARIDGLLVVAGPTAPPIDARALSYRVDKPDAPGQRALWRAALGDTAAPSALVDQLASQYRLGSRTIARSAARVAPAGTPEPHAAVLRDLGRDTATRMGTLARRIDARATWDDLILPEAQKRTLEQIAVHARHRITVQHDWGFADKGGRGLGIASLFSGESGTGKTLAAEVLANTLGLALYRIDLSAIISKYIGETEKNLRTVFDAAEDVGAILLFDEADALFGKRSEVKDSHDRYANIEVSYLLQRMEAYRGLAILTTNHKAALDTAFSRRLRFVVHFPYPDARQRETIWRTTFPSGTPLQDLDYAKLARLNATGGNIRNIALAAAFLAAEAGTAVGMAHLLRAAHVEAAKRETAPSDAETRGWT
ncbi:ATP-binding protein [Comamonadaceae bacterium G21597-S1]|nr:ATP-binding protein [Comamonadaceae bacterium G21597-S1]